MHYYCFWLYHTIFPLFMYSVCNPLLCLLDIHLTGTSSPLSVSHLIHFLFYFDSWSSLFLSFTSSSLS